MRRSRVVAHLEDARDFALRAHRHVGRRSLAEYLDDELLRAGVERYLMNVGEALVRLRRDAPDVAARLVNLAQVIGMRNRLVHEYKEVDPRIPYEIAVAESPLLADELASLITEVEHDARYRDD